MRCRLCDCCDLMHAHHAHMCMHRLRCVCRCWCGCACGCGCWCPCVRGGGCGVVRAGAVVGARAVTRKNIIDTQLAYDSTHMSNMSTIYDAGPRSPCAPSTHLRVRVYADDSAADQRDAGVSVAALGAGALGATATATHTATATALGATATATALGALGAVPWPPLRRLPFQ